MVRNLIEGSVENPKEDDDDATFMRAMLLTQTQSMLELLEAEVKVEAGIITIKCKDGSVLDFTEPKVIKEAD